MMKQLKLVCMMFVVLVLVLAFAPGVLAGDLEPVAGPDDPASAMYTLEDAYNRLKEGAAGAKRTGGFTEPSSAPGKTGVTLDQVIKEMPTADDANGAAPEEVADGKTYWSLRTDGSWGKQTGTLTSFSNGPRAPVEKTGQTTQIREGDDGNLQKGVDWPTSRFTDNGDGTVTDNLTGLIWLKNANKFDLNTWAQALDVCSGLKDDGTHLTDGSEAGAWRLPNIKELLSLIDYGNHRPALPSNHPFDDVQRSRYWTSTDFSSNNEDYVLFRWVVNMTYGGMGGRLDDDKDANHVWPVRDGN
jgi:hypothetical protein